MNKLNRIVTGVSMLSTLSLSAADLRLSGTGSESWDFDTANWLDASGAAVKYADGNNVTIGSDFTGDALMLNAWLSPGEVVFDNAQEIVLSTTENKFGFSAATKSITKRGAGTLRLKPMWNYNTCDWYIYDGRLTTEDAWCGDNNTFGGGVNHKF